MRVASQAPSIPSIWSVTVSITCLFSWLSIPSSPLVPSHPLLPVPKFRPRYCTLTRRLSTAAPPEREVPGSLFQGDPQQFRQSFTGRIASGRNDAPVDDDDREPTCLL